MNILVTGGAGYIGSHTVLELLSAGHQVSVIDNLVNSSAESLKRVQALTGKSLTFYQCDLRDTVALDKILATKPDAVVHFAALKSVGDSVSRPLDYYDNNIAGTIALCQAMERAGVRRIVFSSSATVYGNADHPPFAEGLPRSAINPYGWTKAMMEQILCDLCASNPAWSALILRYFNPVGAHESGQIGEDPRGVPSNLVPFVAQVAVGRLPEVKVFGHDYPTPDGTGLRDYIHVVDVALGHLKAIEHLSDIQGAQIFNLGTGQPHSVLDVIRTFETVSGKPVPYQLVGRRPGDVAASFADPSKALTQWGFSAKRTLIEMCRDTWKWQSLNPMGYQGH